MGDPATKVDLLLLGDGYTKAEAKKFEADARRLTAVLFSTSPFKEHASDFNVWGLCPAANESGISRPSTGVYRDSLATYDAFGSERYVLSFDNRALRKVAQFAPYEFVEILANNRTYGGGGVFNLYSTVAVDNAFANYVFVHEFGHHFAGLADEYYTSAVSYETATERVEPWEPDATALLDPAKLKWKDLVAADTPIPTPWNKEEFEKYSLGIQKRRAEIRKQKLPESVMEALFREELQHEQAIFRKEKYYGRVGAFEGSIFTRQRIDPQNRTKNPKEFSNSFRSIYQRQFTLYHWSMIDRMPTIFFGHGNPLNALARNVYTEGWSAIGESIPRPKTVLCISAHWYLPGTSVTAMSAPRTIHDLGGFPREL